MFPVVPRSDLRHVRWTLPLIPVGTRRRAPWSNPSHLPSLPRMSRWRLSGAHVDGPDQRRSLGQTTGAHGGRFFRVGRERCEEPHATGRQHRRHCGCALRGRPLQVESHASSARRGPFDRILWRNRTSPDPRPGRLTRRHALPAVPNPEPSARLFFVPRSAVPWGSASRRRPPGRKEILQWPTRC